MLEYRTCCEESGREDERFRCCPHCGQQLLRCPSCRGLISPLGHCSTCVRPEVELPRGLILKQGEATDVHVRVLNRGAAPFRMLGITCRSGSVTGDAAVRGLPVAPGLALDVQVHLSFDSPGHFNLELQLELEWRHAARLGFRALCTQAVEVRGRLDGPLISASSEGTGNLINVSGLSDQVLRDALQSAGAAAAQRLHLSMSQLPAEALDGFGDTAGIVSWATTLEAPDMYSGGGFVSATPCPERGLFLGRERATSGGGGDEGTDITLRFPATHPRSRQLSMELSRRHWRLFPWGGTWWMEQLGQAPTLLLLPDEQRHHLQRGERLSLPGGTRIYALGHSTERLGLLLAHSQHDGRSILRSVLRYC